MKREILPNGNLQLVMEPGDEEMVQTLLERHQGNDKALMADMLDQLGWIGNAILQPINAKDIGALTDAPIITDELVIGDNGKAEKVGNVWWFSPYESRNFAEVLLENGHVNFNYAHPVPQDTSALENNNTPDAPAPV